MDRRLLKKEARELMKRYYLHLFFACIFIENFFVRNHFESARFVGEYPNPPLLRLGNSTHLYMIPDFLSSFILYWQQKTLYVIMSYRAFFVATTVALILTVLIFSVLEVGAHKILLDVSKGEPVRLSDLFWGFKKGRYIRCMCVMCVMKLKIVLWSLLVLIPGIIKSYEYSMIPYLLVEYEEDSMKVLFNKSAIMTEGRKMDLFVLSLSFIPYYLLAGAFIQVLYVFVEPYYRTCYVLAYRHFQEEDERKRNMAALYPEIVEV
ncbi:DUF975 family protein [Filifactor villosus]|uniref:DUF975 family protein n=1 Tax=Filifactor villosus TaxID=29374 RepID=A0ABV9QIU6_9FIRM